MSHRYRFWARSLPQEFDHDPQSGWAVHTLYRGPADSLNDLGVHVAVLSEGKVPHLPHTHDEEEIIVMLSGHLDVLTDRGCERIGPGTLYYYPPNERHTNRGAGPGPAVFYVLKWKGRRRPAQGACEGTFMWHRAPNDLPEYSAGRGARVVTGLDIPTPYLNRLRCLYAELAPGAGDRPHSHRHAVLTLMHRGQISGLFHRTASPAAIYCGGGLPHAHLNHGAEPAAFFAIEFH